MLRKQLVVGTLALVTGMLGYSTILPAAPEATVVDSSGAGCISAGSEVDSLTVDDLGVRLEVNGSCSGSAGTPSGLQNIETVAIDEGDAISINLGEGVTVKLPFAVSVTKSILGQTPILNDTVAIYKAPVPGTVPVTGDVDSFSFTFSDKTGNSETRAVTIPINWVEPVIEDPSEVCVESATVDCKGRLTEWPSGSLVSVRIGEGITHVYHFDYDKASNNIGSFMAFDGQLKVVSVSLSANDFSLTFPCQITQLGLQHALRYAPAGEEGFGECPLEDGKRYYLNIKSTVSAADSYSLTVR